VVRTADADVVTRVSQIVDQLPKQHGLVPYYINTDSGQFKQTTLTLGARADSYYECACCCIRTHLALWHINGVDVGSPFFQRPPPAGPLLLRRDGAAAAAWLRGAFLPYS
jgi:hypothetical protein